MKLFSSLHLLVSPLKKVVFVMLIAMTFAAQKASAINVVVSDGSAGTATGTLAWAISQVNAAGAGPHNIIFSVASCQTGWYSVSLDVSNVTVTGGFTGCDPNVVIQGPAGPGAFNITGSNNIIKGIQFSSVEMNISGNSNKIVGCWFNLNSGGTAGAASYSSAKAITVSGTSNVIGMASPCTNRNVFSGYSSAAYTNVIIVSAGANSTAVAGNYIGTDKTGTIRTGNYTAAAIKIGGGSNIRVDSNTVVGGAAIADEAGIYTSGSATNGLLIRRNYIGVNSSGLKGATSLGFYRAGIRLSAPADGITIQNNVVCGNGQIGVISPGSSPNEAQNSGIYVDANSGGSLINNLQILNNFVGVDLAYALAGNDFAGIYLHGNGGAGNITNSAITGNVIGDNGWDPVQKSHGIATYLITSANLSIRGNYIGISNILISGSYKNIGNHSNGIEINTSSGITIGGTTLAEANVICHNKGENSYSAGPFHARTAAGIMITNSCSSINVYGNSIGVAPDGSAAGQLNTPSASDNNGIVVERSSSNINIGGTSPGQPNIIANNGTHGVVVARSAFQVRISRNVIFCNNEMGISLDFPEEYEEPAGTSTPGNLSIAAPVINTKNATTVTGTAPANSTVEVFNISSSCPRVCGDANKLQGYQYVTTATADGSGNWTATGSFGSEVTATAYLAASGTSEFSTCNILCLVPTITISGTTTQCANAGDVTFTNTATVDGTYSYTWSVSGGLTINGSATNPASVVVTIGATGGTLTLSATGPCGPATSNVTITVNPRPVVSVTPTSVDVCLGTGTTLTASHTGGGGTYTYTWSPTTNLTIGGTNNNTATFSSAATVGTYNYTINVTGGNGCTDLTPATATVNVLPRPDVSAVVGSASVCQGVGTTITASHTGGNGTYTYTWSPTTDLTIGGTNNNTGTFSTSASVGVHTYTINVTGGNGCTDLTPATATVTVLARPTVSVTPTSPTVCEGLGTTLTASVSGGSGSYTFSWTPTTNLTLSGTGNNTGTFSSSAAVGTYNYNINVTGGNGCAAAADATASVTVNAAPNVAVTPTSPSVCQGVGTTLTASHTGGSGTYTYTWAPTTNLTIGGTNDNTGTFSSSATPGTYNYTINVTGGNGCADLTPATASVTVNARPTVSVTPTGPSICQGTGTTLTASVSGGSGSYTFSWSPMTDITLSGSGNNTATFSSSASVGTHTYNINVTGGNGCAANADAVATVTVDQSVTADAGSDASSCANPIALSANTPGVGTGAWTLVSGAGSFSSTSDPNGTFTFSGAAPVSAQVRWTVTNGACTADELITLNLTTGPVSDATNVAPICDQTSTSISATATNGTGVWAVVSGPGTIVDVNAASTTINGLVAGSPTVLSFTVTNGTCPTPAVDQITITVDAAVTANAGSDDDLCNATTTTLAATGTGIWTTTSGTGVVTTANDPASGVTGLTIGGTSVFTWTVTSANAACTDNASVTITSRALPVSDAGDDITSCAASVDLDANDVLAGTWTVVSGSGIFVDANDPNTSVSGLGAGTNIFEWTVSGGGVCTDASSQVTVSTGASDLILEAFGDDDTLCVGSERKLNLTASGGSQDFTYVWTSIPSGFNMTTTDPIITVVPNSGYTQYVVYAYDNNAVGCASDDDTVEVYAISRQELYLPNLMTPNEDGHNDVYIIKDVRTGHDIFPGSYFEVVNRWGQQVYKSESYDNTWDAREQSDGMYFYFLETGCGDEIYKGWVQILGNNKP